MLLCPLHTGHPHFYNQLFSGADEIGLLASFLSVASNTNVYTFEMAPVFSLMESEVLHKLRELVGWREGQGDGIFSPGGSMSNLYGLVLARFYNAPESKVKGILCLPQMAVFCSEDVSLCMFVEREVSEATCRWYVLSIMVTLRPSKSGCSREATC